jgi:release factor glutamine methyltransferase
MEKIWTIIQLLNETQKYFKKKGIESPRLDAEILLAFALNKERIKLYIDFESPINDKELSTFRELVKRRAKREPVAYITGFKEFWSTTLKVTEDVLIPRPETELIVEQTLKLIKSNHSKGNKIVAADIGTGSGAISIALAIECSDISFLSVDISLKALKVAKENIYLNGLEAQVFAVCADSYYAFKEIEVFDFILSNPPYVLMSDIAGLQPEITDFEPYLALDGGEDGLDFYRNSLPGLCRLLKSGGFAVFEIGDEQGESVTGIFEESGAFVEVDVLKDYSGQDRLITARKKG